MFPKPTLIASNNKIERLHLIKHIEKYTKDKYIAKNIKIDFLCFVKVFSQAVESEGDGWASVKTHHHHLSSLSSSNEYVILICNPNFRAVNPIIQRYAFGFEIILNKKCYSVTQKSNIYPIIL